MRKHIKNSSKRKWVVGGVAFFGAVALLTTGFASWVVGVLQTSQEGVIGVTVDTVQNNTAWLSVTPHNPEGEKIVAAEDDDVTGGKIINASPEVTANFITTWNISLQLGATSTYDKITFAVNPDTLLSGTDILGSTISKRTTDLKYIDVSTADLDLTLSELTQGETTNGVTSYTGSFTLTFKWGAFFGDVSPCTYYNNLKYGSGESAAEDTDADLFANQSKVYQEMDAFYKAYNGKDIKVTATLSASE